MSSNIATYSLGSDHQERQRLTYQASLIDQMTERFLYGAGLSEGMRVLDVGEVHLASSPPERQLLVGALLPPLGPSGRA